MHRLLIVDDERLIADGIYEVLQNTKDLELDIYKAYSAKEALALLKTARIDITVTDIRMPGMDGMRLLHLMKGMWPQCRILILTGYSQFDYIYQAVQYTGVSYLLKSEGYDKIIARVREIITDIEKGARTADIMLKARDEITFNRAFIQKDYLSSILTRQTTQNEINQGQFDEYGIPLDATLPVLLLLGQTDMSMEDRDYSEKMKLIYGIRTICQEYFAGQIRQVQITYERNGLIWFIQPNKQDKSGWDPDVWHDTSVFISGVLETVQSVCKDSMGVSISFAVSCEPAAWQEVPAVYDRLLIFFERWANNAEGFIYTMAEKEDPQGYANVIKRLEGFIQQNIDKDLSLIKLSEYAHFNPSYLSRLFKRLTNLNLSEFINDARLRKAKELLGTDMKIHEVAEAVGYESSKNFARFFKRQTNMTPQEYKDLAK